MSEQGTRYAALGSGYCGCYETREEAEAVQQANGDGAVYVRLGAFPAVAELSLTVLTDEQVRALYHIIIGVSWESSDHFLGAQDAWKAIATECGVERIENNGWGRVVRLAMPSPPTRRTR